MLTNDQYMLAVKRIAYCIRHHEDVVERRREIRKAIGRLEKALRDTNPTETPLPTSLKYNPWQEVDKLSESVEHFIDPVACLKENQTIPGHWVTSSLNLIVLSLQLNPNSTTHYDCAKEAVKKGERALQESPRSNKEWHARAEWACLVWLEHNA